MNVRAMSRMRRHGLVTATGGLALVLAASSAPPAAATPTQPPVSELSDADVAGATLMAKWLAERIAGAAIGKGTGFIIDAIGFPNQTAAKLDQLGRQLDQLSAQLTDLQNSVNELVRRLDDSDLKDQITELREKNNALNNLYRDEFIPVVDAAQVLAKAKEDGKDTTGPQRDLDAARDRFYAQYDVGASTYASIAKDIHDYLMPGPGNSILAAQGRTLLNRNRYITAQHSQRIRAMYDALADQQAMAVWMHAERNVVFRPPVYKRVIDDYTAWRKRELENLPPQIHPDAVVDTGRKIADTTQRKQMWTPPSVQGLRHRPPYQGQVYEGVGTVPRQLKLINDREQAGFKDWSVPTVTQFVGLYSGPDGRPPASSERVSTFLSKINGGSSLWSRVGQGTWPILYTDTVRINTFRWRDRNTSLKTIKLPVYTGVISANGQVAPVPAEPVGIVRERDWSPFGSITGYVNNMFTQQSARGGFLATRPVGVTRNGAGLPIDYMAQLGSGVTARAVQSRSKLRVKVTPKLPKGSWRFRVQKRHKGSWKAVKNLRTRGKLETRTVNMPKGRYRIVVPSSHGCVRSKSDPVRLLR